MMKIESIDKTYYQSLILIFALFSGAYFGYHYPEQAHQIAPLGDLFLNLVLTLMVPLIFFSIAKASATLKTHHQMGKMFQSMLGVYLCTGLIAAFLSYLILYFIPLTPIPLAQSTVLPTQNFLLFKNIKDLLSVSQFSDLLSHQHMLALMFLSMLIGIAGGNQIVHFLEVGESILMKVFAYIMYYAPIGFFAYFANMVADLGPQMIKHYTQLSLTYYLFAIFYFIVVYSLYAYYAHGLTGLYKFWKYISVPATTALATCSSVASIPANYRAAQHMGVRADLYEACIPFGTLIHKDGSIIGGMFKIAFLMAAFHLDFSGFSVVFLAMFISLLVGTVMGAIPSGGMLGELLILSVYGFPSSALVSIVAISVIIDPIATMLNTCGNTIACMLINKQLTQ